MKKFKLSKQLVSMVLILVMLAATSCGTNFELPMGSSSNDTSSTTPTPTETITTGIGDSVNLLVGSYTDFASGTISIFDEELLGAIGYKETIQKSQVTNVACYDDLQSYVDHLTVSVNAKLGFSASTGVPKLVNATSGYSFELGVNYEKKTQHDTKTVFYDMDYLYTDRRVEIKGYNDTAKLSAALSEEFLNDAAKLQNGEMTPEAFIRKYGTHVVTAGIYGAKFNLHYEMISDSETMNKTFGVDVKTGITSQIGATIKGIDIGTSSETGLNVDYSAFQSNDNKNIQTKFTAKAVGGNATGMAANSLSAFESICASWASSLNNTDSYVIIDVPNNSLFFVWDYLGEEYIEAKNILDHYFYNACDESYYALKDKVSSIYKDSFTFDEATGTLTINLSGLQDYASASLNGIDYKMNDTDLFNSSTGTFTIYSRYNGHEIKRVVFEGSYGTTDSLGRKISTQFSPLKIYFDEWWSGDVTVEFKNFAFTSPAGNSAIDFSATKLENVSLVFTGPAYIKGGDGKTHGGTAINATGINLSISGDDIIEISGGNGGDPSKIVSYTRLKYDQIIQINGYNGGDGINAKHLTIDVQEPGKITIRGGNGSDGVDGINGTNASDYTGYGTSATHGGDGGNGGNAISVDSYNIANTSNTYLYGGDGGNGADGGDGGNGVTYQGRGPTNIHDPVGGGGAAGNGGDGGKTGIDFDLDNDSCGGSGGTGGDAGDAGAAGCFWWDPWIGDTQYFYGDAGASGSNGTDGVNG